MLSETAVSGLLSFEALLDTQGRGARQRISGESGNPPEELCEAAVRRAIEHLRQYMKLYMEAQ